MEIFTRPAPGTIPMAFLCAVFLILAWWAGTVWGKEPELLRSTDTWAVNASRVSSVRKVFLFVYRNQGKRLFLRISWFRGSGSVHHPKNL